MMLIGVDPHNSTHTATALDPATNSHQGSIRIDAAVAASVAAMHGDARPVHPETRADSLALLDERRKTVSENRTRSVNQLHALLRELLPGGGSHEADRRQGHYRDPWSAPD